VAVFSTQPPQVDQKDPVKSLRALTNYVSGMQEAIDYAITQMRKDAQELAATVEKQGKEITVAQGRLGSLATDLSSLRGQVNGLGNRVSALENRVTALENR